jgi:hypothetical protein
VNAKKTAKQKKPVMSEIRAIPVQNSNHKKAEKVHTPTRAAELNESQFASVSYTTEQFKAMIGDTQGDNVVLAEKENPMSMALRHMGNSTKLSSKYSSTGRPSSTELNPAWNRSTNKSSPRKSFNSASRRSPNFQNSCEQARRVRESVKKQNQLVRYENMMASLSPQPRYEIPREEPSAAEPINLNIAHGYDNTDLSNADLNFKRDLNPYNSYLQGCHESEGASHMEPIEMPGDSNFYSIQPASIGARYQLRIEDSPSNCAMNNTQKVGGE